MVNGCILRRKLLLEFFIPDLLYDLRAAGFINRKNFPAIGTFNLLHSFLPFCVLPLRSGRA